MTDQPLEWLLEQPAGLSLLAAYAQREAEVPRKPRTAEAAPAPVPDPPVTVAEGDDEEDDSATWIPRLTLLPGVDPAELPPLHGRLIALGLLKFELFGRTGGMRYRVSTAGRQALAAAPAVVAEAVPAAEIAA